MTLNAVEEDFLIPKKVHKDKYKIVYVIIFFTGIGVLLPWNFFITARQYFMFKLSDEVNGTHSSNVTNDLQFLFENYLSIASMLPVVLVNFVNLVLRRHITPMRRFMVGICIMFLVFIFTLVLTTIDTGKFVNMFFTITMISVVILNLCSGIVQGSSLGIVSMMPGRYIKGFMEGQAASGLIASVANIISIAVIGSPDVSASMYFSMALVFLAITGIGFCQLGKIKFSRNYVKMSSLLDHEVENDIQQPLTSDSIPVSFSRGRQSFFQKYYQLIKIIYWNGLSVMMGFLVTLSLFPAVISQIETTSDNPNWQKYFTPVACFLLFNIADYFGRFLCGFVKFPSQNYPKCLFALSMMRWILVPLIFMCNIPRRKYFPLLLNHDAYPILLTLIFGLSNGYTLTLGLIYAPTLVKDNEKEAVGNLMNVFMCLGLAVGVGLSFLFNFII